MIKILIYGDSNVWGDNFITSKRIDDDKQWVNILQKKLGTNYQLIQEGLPGRLAGNDERDKPYKNGQTPFIPIFRTSSPIDKIVIALGTNDLQIKYNKDSQKIIEDLKWYTDVLEESYKDLDDRKKYFKNESMPEIIYIMPINFDYMEDAKVVFDENSEKKRQEIINYFLNEKKYKCVVLDKMDLFNDGLHLNHEGHKKMADKMMEVLKND